jgi:hypothetical protein
VCRARSASACLPLVHRAWGRHRIRIRLVSDFGQLAAGPYLRGDGSEHDAAKDRQRCRRGGKHRRRRRRHWRNRLRVAHTRGRVNRNSVRARWCRVGIGALDWWSRGGIRSRRRCGVWVRLRHRRSSVWTCHHRWAAVRRSCAPVRGTMARRMDAATDVSVRSTLTYNPSRVGHDGVSRVVIRGRRR